MREEHSLDFFTEMLNRVNPNARELKQLLLAHHLSLMVQASLPELSSLRAQFVISEDLKEDTPIIEQVDQVDEPLNLERSRKATQTISAEEMKNLVSSLLRKGGESSTPDPLDAELSKIIPAERSEQIEDRSKGAEPSEVSVELKSENPLEEYLLDNEPVREGSDKSSGDDSNQQESQLFRELSSYASEGHWSKIVERVEREQFAQGERQPELQLWWIYAQLEMNSVPALILSAPFETLSIEMFNPETYGRSSNQSKSLLRTVLMSLVVRLQKSGDHAFALSFLDRAMAVDSSYREYLKRFEQEEEELLSTIPDYRKTEAQLDRQKALKESRKTHKQSDRRESANTSQSTSPLQVLQSRFSTSWHDSKAIRAGSVLALSLILFMVWPVFKSKELVEQARLPQLLIEPVESLVGFPEAEKVSTVKLDAILYQMDETARKGPMVPTSVREFGEAGDSVTESRPSLARVNTSGPLEPKDFPRVAEAYAPRAQQAMENSAPQPAFPRLYRVIAATRVVNGPQHRAERVTELYRGDKVEVEGQDGRWLRLRSNNGEVGYILSQDVVPVQESR